MRTLIVNGTVTLSKDGYINGPIVLAYNNVDALGKFIDALKPGTAAKNAGNLQQLGRAVVRDTRGGELRCPDLQSGDALRAAAAPRSLDLRLLRLAAERQRATRRPRPQSSLVEEVKEVLYGK